MTRQLPKPIAVPLGWVIFGAINGFIYGGGWLCMRWDDLCGVPGRLTTEWRLRRVGTEAEEWLKGGVR